MAIFISPGRHVLTSMPARLAGMDVERVQRKEGKKMYANSWLWRFCASLLLMVALAPSAQAGFDEAMAAYRSGNTTVAFKEFMKAAEAGDRYAQVMVGNMYLEGTGTERDAAKAATWLERAATGGHSYAQYALGLLYMSGQGVPKDAAKGVAWLDKAAQQGSFFAQTTLGDAYANGIGVAVDKARAVSYYASAADQNYAIAQLKLSSTYYLGQGVTRNTVEAYKWAYLAALQLSTAATVVQQFQKELSARELAQGEAAAKTWRAAKGLGR